MKRILTIFLLIFAIIVSSLSFTACDDLSTSENNGGAPDNGITDEKQGGGSNSGEDNSDNNSGNTDSGIGDSGNNGDTEQTHTHTDSNDDEKCDTCFESVVVVLDFYALNDLHGKFCDGDTHPGVDELATYLKTMRDSDDNFILLSSGDMWQGAAESNLTTGLILTEWMNEMDFVSMTIGNHEYDWGSDAIKANLAVAEFPFLAINIYDKSTGKRVDYCQPSVLIERDGIQIGIIGAVGDCYTSISSNMVSGVEFKVGSELTALVKAESNRLKSLGADLIVYSVHDGYGNYDQSLSNGYVDICFEAHTHQSYVTYDNYSICHIQGGGDNSGISHVEIKLNIANDKKSVSEAEVVKSSVYSQYSDDPATEAIEDKYADVIAKANEVLGTVSSYMSSEKVEDTVAELYLRVGLERWSDEYNIVLGGGFIKTRSPNHIQAGLVTYGDLLDILPFDNRLVLCSVSGSKLKSQFLETTNSDYHITCSDYGNSIINNISSSATYYVVVDTYTALFAPNGLTVIDYYDDGVYARDLLAWEIKSGRFYESHDGYTLTSISNVLQIGAGLAAGEQTSEKYYVKGRIVSVANSTYGNLYLEDEYGNRIYVYGLYDQSGNRYNVMSTKPVAGDTIVVYAPILNYQGNGYTQLELIDATLIGIL